MALFNRILLWPLLLTCHLLMVALVSWLLLAKVDFLYPLAYQLLDIEQHIQEYGPQNRYKSGFEQTPTEVHQQLFHEINRAVHQQGEGLADIHYELPSGGSNTLLRTPEVIHLQDVANLIDHLVSAGLTAALLWCVLLIHAWQQRLQLPSAKKILSGFAIAVIALTFVILAAGPTRVFYWLHTVIFPDEHEWFFFYEDSLMTTLMKAPDLFGVISVFFMMLLISLWLLTLGIASRLLQHRHPIVGALSTRKTRQPKK
jgi:hypothetical protein